MKFSKVARLPGLSSTFYCCCKILSGSFLECLPHFYSTFYGTSKFLMCRTLCCICMDRNIVYHFFCPVNCRKFHLNYVPEFVCSFLWFLSFTSSGNLFDIHYFGDYLSLLIGDDMTTIQ